jgi:glucose/arabinose dehydrogenase
MRYPGNLALALVVAAAVGIAAQAVPQGGRAQGGGAQGAGRGGAPGAAPAGGGGRGCPAATAPAIPAAESCVSTQLGQANWPDPPLPDGPITIQSALNQHRDLRVVIIKGFNQPWSMAWLPDGTMLVTERAGRLRIVRGSGSSSPVLDPTPVAGLPPIQAGGLQGLMDVVVHPRFAENRYVYLSYHKPVAVMGADGKPAIGRGGAPQMAGATTIARGTWNGTTLVDIKDIWHDPTAVRTESSRIGFGRDGMLYMSVSASGTGPDVMRSADPNDIAGKTIRLRDDGTIPPDNPFYNRAGYRKEIYTLGHRNGHSMQMNPETGQFWVTEQGPNGGDEINILKPGANYGWPYVSNGRNYSGPKISGEMPWKEGTEQPWVVWVPSIAVTGGTFYTGDKFPGWRRSFFVGGLRQGESPRTGQMQRIEFNDKWEEIRREPMLVDLHQRIRDVRTGPDGFLYAATSENEGAILRIEPAPAPTPAR